MYVYELLLIILLKTGSSQSVHTVSVKYHLQ